MSSSRPQTPSSKRRSLRSSGLHLLSQSPKVHYPVDEHNLPMDSHINVERFARLSDSIEELDVNMSHLQRIHEVLSSKFNESFASFLYGLSITMWCVDFPGCPTKAMWERLVRKKESQERARSLQAKIARAKEENAQLRRRLEEEKQDKPPVEEAPSNNSSFLSNPPVPTRSRIPQPRRYSPNLNQAPRYMQKTLTTVNSIQQKYGDRRIERPRQERKRPKLSERPPFR